MNALKKPTNEKAYISEIDSFLNQFRRDNPEKSSSQKAKIALYNRIYYLRDHPVETEQEKNEKLWSEF